MTGEGGVRPKEYLVSVFGCVYYVSMSLLLLCVNKSLLATFGFRWPMFILLCQSSATMLVFCFLWLSKTVTSFDRPSWGTLLKLASVYLLGITASLSAMDTTSLLMFNTLRRTSILFVLMFEWSILGQRPDLAIIGSVVVIVTGALIAGYDDLAFDSRGYFLAVLANVSTSLYLIFIKQSQQRAKADALALLFFNTVLTWPLLLAIALGSGQLAGAVADLQAGKPSSLLLLTLLSSSFLGFFLNHATYYNTGVNSPLTHTVMAQLKDVLLLLVSVLGFDRKVISKGTFQGALVSFGGSVLYAGVKYYARRQAAAQLQDQAPDDPSDSQGAKAKDD